jgi:ribonuclease-3
MKPTSSKELDRTLGVTFRNRKLLLAAITHPSFLNEYDQFHARQRMKSNQDFQRFEFLGDAVLNYFIAAKLYETFPKADEGLLSRLRSILVSRKLLARIARSIRLGRFLLLGTRERGQPVPTREKILADAFESLLAAIYFDRGLKAAEKFLLKCFLPYLDQKKLFRFDPNPKSALQESAQKKFHILPKYRVDRASDGLFTASVTLKKNLTAEGKGHSKQEAETQAARALLKKLKAKKTSSI